MPQAFKEILKTSQNIELWWHFPDKYALQSALPEVENTFEHVKLS
jgi:hypothetical protein